MNFKRPRWMDGDVIKVFAHLKENNGETVNTSQGKMNVSKAGHCYLNKRYVGKIIAMDHNYCFFQPHKLLTTN